MKKFTKELCDSCNLNGDCCCQRTSQHDTNNCGMEQVLDYNKHLLRHSQTYENPDYVDFMQDSY